MMATIGSLYFSGQAVRQSTEQARQAQVAQTSERFSRSVEQLGSDSMAVRVGSVYSFARLMRDSPDDQEAIVRILSGLVRVQTAQVSHPARPKRQAAPADVRAALGVLADQPEPRPVGVFGILPTMLLDGVDFSGFELAYMPLRDAQLQGANLSGANLQRAALSSVTFTGADLSGADLREAGLSGASLRGASLKGADLSGASLRDVYAKEANLTGANLSGAILIDGDLTGANFTGAVMTRAHLTGADLTGADLTRAVDIAHAVCSPQTIWPQSIPPAQRPLCTATG
ncbi:pentapeptide repeat-containing protein [Kribbella sp. CA-294648]|uniref:pentapeptide repeat-containing protein n=1 Tax=Kribbella sp. CA-294648 TaxID=3239948 RepID=UPI003D927BE9